MTGQNKTFQLREIAGEDVIASFPENREIKGCLVFLSGEAQSSGWYVFPEQAEPVRIFKREVRDILVSPDLERPVLKINPTTLIRKDDKRYGLTEDYKRAFYTKQILA